MPADKNPFGKYLNERYGVVSTPTREKGSRKQIRYYPDLYMVKTAHTAYCEHQLQYNGYSSYRMATGELQEKEGQITYSNHLATAATGELLILVYREIDKMYEFIKPLAGKFERKITWESYLNSPVAAVANTKNGSNDCDKMSTGETPISVDSPVANQENKAVDNNTLTTEEKSPVASAVATPQNSKKHPIPLGEDEERLKTVQSVFKAKAPRDKPILSMSEFMFGLTLDKKWGPPEKVRQLLKDAEARGWIRTTGEDSTEMVECLI
jgi:hypothetical protein